MISPNLDLISIQNKFSELLKSFKSFHFAHIIAYKEKYCWH